MQRFLQGGTALSGYDEKGVSSSNSQVMSSGLREEMRSLILWMCDPEVEVSAGGMDKSEAHFGIFLLPMNWTGFDATSYLPHKAS